MDHPLQWLTLGTWSLLPEIRNRVANWLDQRATELWGSRDWQDGIPTLLHASLERWNRRYAEPRYWEDVAHLTGNPRPLHSPSTVITYLENCLNQISGLGATGASEVLTRLVVPYLLPIDPWEEIGWWFPPRVFLESPTRPPSPYPLLDDSFFSLFEPRASQERTHVTQPLTPDKAVRQPDSPEPADPTRPLALRRFAEGMTSLQTKIIGDYDLLAVRTKPWDRLIGNGAAILYVFHHDNHEATGTLCVASPVYGLFHHLLLRPAAQLDGVEKFDTAFLCRSQLTDDRDRLRARDGQYDRLPIRFCRHCSPGGGLTPRCPLFGFSMAVGPIAAPYLKAIADVQRTAAREAEFAVLAAQRSAVHIAKDPCAFATDAIKQAHSALLAGDSTGTRSFLECAYTLLQPVDTLYNVVIRQLEAAPLDGLFSSIEQLPPDYCTPLADFIDELTRWYGYLEPLYTITFDVDVELGGYSLDDIRLNGELNVLMGACSTIVANAVRKLREQRRHADEGREPLPPQSIRVAFRVPSAADAVELEVRDSGPPMDVAIQQKVDALIAAPESFPRRAGLGLSSTRFMLHRHRGALREIVNEGGGVVARLRLAALIL